MKIYNSNNIKNVYNLKSAISGAFYYSILFRQNLFNLLNLKLEKIFPHSLFNSCVSDDGAKIEINIRPYFILQKIGTKSSLEDINIALNILWGDVLVEILYDDKNIQIIKSINQNINLDFLNDYKDKIETAKILSSIYPFMDISMLQHISQIDFEFDTNPELFRTYIVCM